MQLSPEAGRPLDGAFGAVQRRRERSAEPAPWTGPTVHAAALDEKTERRILRQADRDAVIAAYGDFDPTRPPVLLVHGINGSGEDLRDIAERLRASGHQVLIAFYSDRGERTHDSGRALAVEMTRVREAHYPHAPALDIVAHSMGGIVSRAALNYLQDPGWLGEDAGLAANPRAGFERVRLHTLDTPWDGFDHEPDIPILGPIMRGLALFFMAIAGWLGAYDMRGNSEMFEHLHDPELEGVEMQNHAARELGKPDAVLALPDFGDGELAAITRHMDGGPLPSNARTRNLARALASDGRYPELVRSVGERRAAGRDDAAALREAYEEVMPRFTGDHDTVLRDDPNRDDDLVDHVLRSVAVPSSRQPTRT